MMIRLIPANIDTFQILLDLNRWGWCDSKIEAACGFSRSYLAQVRRVNVRTMSYPKAARLYNFWVSELELQYTPTDSIQATAESTA